MKSAFGSVRWRADSANIADASGKTVELGATLASANWSLKF